MSKRKLLPFVAAAVVTILVLFYHNSPSRDTWRKLPQHVGLGEHMAESEPPKSSSPKQPTYENWNPKPDFKKGSSMPSGHNYTSVLVIAKTKKEDISWMDDTIADQQKAIYVADDPYAPLHPPKNKGHEVMIYLTYIIDNYDNLPDVSIFMHAHQYTWHNDDILDNNAALLVSQLSRQRVWREGYVNMRCGWFPGCPDWMHPGEAQENANKPEEVQLAKSWSELFPLDPIPDLLAQPCCAQFAISRERIQALPHSKYVWYRQWLFNTQLPDHLSGRVWEYVWQYVFTGANKYCPEEHICFCDGFGMCFGGKDEYNSFLSVKGELSDRQNDLRNWEDKKKAIEEAEEEGRTHEAEQLEKPEPGKDQEYQAEISRLQPIFNKLKEEARKRGQDPKNRAHEAGRDWKEGDDF